MMKPGSSWKGSRGHAPTCQADMRRKAYAESSAATAVGVVESRSCRAPHIVPDHPDRLNNLKLLPKLQEAAAILSHHDIVASASKTVMATLGRYSPYRPRQNFPSCFNRLLMHPQGDSGPLS